MCRKADTIAFWRGRLPHWEVVEGRYFVTIHLAGAIPMTGQRRIRQLAAKLDTIASEDRDGQLRIQRLIYSEMEVWLDSAPVVSYLSQPDLARIVTEAIGYRHTRCWNVLEYVVMPSHLHMFFEVLDGRLKEGLELFKRWTGHAASRCLALPPGKRFWQDEWFDHWSRSDEEDERIINYIRHNPVKANLVRDYQDWPHGGWQSGSRPE